MIKIEEIWKDIKDYEGRYQVNKLGEVLSIRQRHDKKRHIHCIKKQYLKPQLWKSKKTNYKAYFVVLIDDGVRETHYIHNLVAKAFIPNPNNYSFVHHVDGDTTNNHIDNLEWCKHFEFREMTDIQRQSAKRTLEKNRKDTKKPIAQYDLEWKFVKCYDSLSEASKQTNINIAHLSEATNGKRKTAGGYHWKTL